jgi:hypothetical protein
MLYMYRQTGIKEGAFLCTSSLLIQSQQCTRVKAQGNGKEITAYMIRAAECVWNEVHRSLLNFRNYETRNFRFNNVLLVVCIEISVYFNILKVL